MRSEPRDFCDWTDSFRAVAATLVVVSHARDVVMIDYPGYKLWLPFYAATGLGHSAVIVFFVLSGFWISRSVLRRIDDRAFWPSYLIDRLSRLGIVLVPALVLGGVLDATGLSWHLPIYRGLPGTHGLIQDVAATLTWPVFIGNLTFLQTIAVKPFGSNEPLWSLAYEFWYYIWFPALALSIGRRRPSLALLTLLIGLANPELYWGFTSWLVGWAVLSGMLAAGSQPIGRGWTVAAAGLFTIMLLATAAMRQSWTDILLAISFGLLLLALARSTLPFPRLLAPLAEYGRRASFSLYAIHFPLLVLLGGWAIGPLRLAPTGRSLMLVLALTAVCLGFGWLFAGCSEALTPRLRNWLRQRLPARAQPGRA